MKTIRMTLLASLALLLPMLAIGATVSGGKKAATDCYGTFQVDSSPSGAVLTCHDGDLTCDADSNADGQCTFNVNVCLKQDISPGTCTPADVTKVTKAGAINKVITQPLFPAFPVTSASCATNGPGQFVVKLRAKGKKPSKVKKLTFTAVTGNKGKLKSDANVLKLQCLPPGSGPATGTPCPANSSGGPSAIRFRIGPTGQDLDVGYSGNSMNSLNVNGGVFNLCLKGCGADGANCTGDDAATNAANGDSFGAPLPLLANGTATCTVNLYDVQKGKISGGAATMSTGAIQGTVNLISVVHLTDRTSICPRCSGANLGDSGTCDSGPRQGKSCVTEGIVTVSGDTYKLSSTCVPASSTELARLTIPLALTTGQSIMANPKATCHAAKNNECGTNKADVPTGCNTTSCPAPANGAIAQFCCDANNAKPCQPTAQIERDGTTTPPADAAGAVGGFPKEHDITLASTFCIGATGSTLVDGIAGLPGPGTDLLAVSACWLKNADPTSGDVPKCTNH